MMQRCITQFHKPAECSTACFQTEEVMKELKELANSIEKNESPEDVRRKIETENRPLITYPQTMPHKYGAVVPKPPPEEYYPPWRRPRLNSRQLVAGFIEKGCSCSKRNGLQDDCKRTGCGGPACLAKPKPLCDPCGIWKNSRAEKILSLVPSLDLSSEEKGASDNKNVDFVTETELEERLSQFFDVAREEHIYYNDTEECNLPEIPVKESCAPVDSEFQLPLISEESGISNHLPKKRKKFHRRIIMEKKNRKTDPQNKWSKKKNKFLAVELSVPTTREVSADEARKLMNTLKPVKPEICSSSESCNPNCQMCRGPFEDTARMLVGCQPKSEKCKYSETQMTRDFYLLPVHKNGKNRQ